jgi:hypothetical protein
MAKCIVCFGIHTKQICCRQNVTFWNVKTAGTYSNHKALKGSIQFISHSIDPIQGHREHMDMEIVRYKIIKKQST